MTHPKRNLAIMIPIVCLSLTLISLGCTSTEAFTSVSDDFASVAAEYEVFAVWSNLLDNNLAQQMEYAFVEALEDYGLVGLSWMDLFPPIREYKTKEYAKAIDEHDIDVIVYVNLQDSDTSTSISSYDGNVYSSTTGYAMFEFTFQPIDLDDPILVTQISVNSDNEEWKHINAAASKRAVKEYTMAAGIEPLPPPEE